MALDDNERRLQWRLVVREKLGLIDFLGLLGDHRYNLAKNAREGSPRRITNKSEEKDNFERTHAVPFTPSLVKILTLWMELRNGEGRMRQMR
ncbi:unnamed protein product [Dovyalis caffra]|uniref:Uncharacterized protein n=1 Tax=Dovyalis caffra TaxID=77055 RepID=A0AAV1S789_9ROSI|nr:unnamed protein product [Dovyalis caffra]